MGNDLLFQGEKKKTFVVKRVLKIKEEIQSSYNALQEAKSDLEQARYDYNSTSKIRIFKKRRLKREYEEANRKLIVANAEANIQIFKILGYTLELIVLCFLIPMDLIQRTGQWCAAGFEKRDAKMASMIRSLIPILNENGHHGKKGKSKSKSKYNILEGVLRILIAILIGSGVVFGIYRLFIYDSTPEKEDAPAVATKVDTSESETINSLQKEIEALKASLDDLKAVKPNSKDLENAPHDINPADSVTDDVLKTGSDALSDSETTIEIGKESAANIQADAVIDSSADTTVETGKADDVNATENISATNNIKNSSVVDASIQESVNKLDEDNKTLNNTDEIRDVSSNQSNSVIQSMENESNANALMDENLESDIGVSQDSINSDAIENFSNELAADEHRTDVTGGLAQNRIENSINYKSKTHNTQNENFLENQTNFGKN